MQENFLAFFGHIAIDVTMRVDKLPTSGTVGVNRMEQNFGGTAGNFAMIAARLNYPFHLYSAVSRKTHSDYLKFLEEIGVDVSHILVDSQDMGPVGYAVTTGEEQIFYFYQGPMETALSDRINLDSLDYRYVHFGTGLPSDFLKFSKLVKDSKIVFDPGQEISYRYSAGDLKPLMQMSHLAILNQSEFKKAASILEMEPQRIIDSCKNLIVTRGKDGSTLYRNGEELNFPSLLVKNPYDTIGAGDAFRAGLYLGLNLGKTLEDSIMLGTVTSSEAIKRHFREFGMDGKSILELFQLKMDELLPK